ncbi:hypothetical protein D3C71_1651030 [compost metagenome]
MPGRQVEQVGDSGGPEFQFLGAHGGYRQRKMAFGCTKYAMAGGPVWSGVAHGKAFKRRTALGPGVTECYRAGSKSDRVVVKGMLSCLLSPVCRSTGFDEQC